MDDSERKKAVRRQGKALTPKTTARLPGTWPLFGALVLAVVIPTAFVLWFMTAAMRNERLAVRERLDDAYGKRLSGAQSALAEFWRGERRRISDVASLPPAQAFEALVSAGGIDSVVLYDESGTRSYPAEPVEAEAEVHPPQWARALALENEEHQPGEAAALFGEIAEASESAALKARALSASARCLVKAGRREEAMLLLSEEIQRAEYEAVRDEGGRLLAPSALFFAVEQSTVSGAPDAADLAVRLRRRLEDYSGAPMPSRQRLFLMWSLMEYLRRPPHFPMLRAEEAALEYIDSTGDGVRIPSGLTETGVADLWRYHCPDGRGTILYRAATLEGAIREKALAPFAADDGVLEVIPPDAVTESFMMIPASEDMPGWTIILNTTSPDPYDEEADRRLAAYFWAGILAVASIVILAIVAGHYVARQMRITRLKNDLLATVSHELKTPLASMRVLVDTLLDGRYEGEARASEYHRLIAKENERLSRLIDNFLTFSRMEEKRRRFELLPMSVADAAREAAKAFEERCCGPGCEFALEIETDLPEIVGDRDAIVTVLLNLLDNAHKYTPGEKEISLRVYSEGALVCLEVGDNGVGLSRREKRKAFERFYQVDRRLSRQSGGCGLGLAIVKFIVDAHCGVVEVRSLPGEGSVFTVRLPVDGARRAQGEGAANGG